MHPQLCLQTCPPDALTESSPLWSVTMKILTPPVQPPVFLSVPPLPHITSGLIIHRLIRLVDARSRRFLSTFPAEVMRHIGSLLHLSKRRACTPLTGYRGDVCKYLLWSASRNTTLWRRSKPLTMRFVRDSHKRFEYVEDMLSNSQSR